MHTHSSATGAPPSRPRIEVPDITPDLPTEPNSFVGRSHELDQLRKLVWAVRMVTLTGPGGIGKTRLALHALAALAGEFPDGACFVELAGVTSPDLVVSRIASAAGVAVEHDRPLIDTLTDALRSRVLVLALDNCEHLLDSCARLCQRLLASAPEVRLLATSREPLRVAGETVWQVPPLPVTAADGSAAEAVELFAQRAVACAPGFTLTPETSATVAEICRAVDGIPLAIELAAARMRVLSAEQILARVADRFGLLTVGDRAAAPRQRTLRAAIDWSHDLLTEQEQVLLRRLSVFAGWSLEMAEQVCADELVPIARLLDTVAALVDKSLVVREPAMPGEARFRMLDTIRAYAAEKLAEAGETAAIKNRFRAHTLAVTERHFAVGMALVPASWQERVDVMRRYDTDAGNVWLVLGDCLADGAVATGLRICTAVRPSMLVRGEFALGCEWVDAFLARPEAADVEPRITGQALIGRAQLTLPADPAGSEPAAREGLRLCRAAGDQFWTAAGLNLLSEIAVRTGRPDEAEALGQEAMTIAKAAGDDWNTGWALSIRAAVAGVRGDIGLAADLARASLDVMRSIDHWWGVAMAELSLGDLSRRRGDLADAQRLYRDALGYLREVSARPQVARCLSGLGQVALALGDLAAAREHLAESLRVSLEIGTRIGMARGLEAFAALASREGDAERAILLAGASGALRATSGLPPPPGARAVGYLDAVSSLGEGRAALLWSRGLALSPEAAIDLAIEQPARARRPRAALGSLPAAPHAPSEVTRRELEIAALIADGHSNKAIAAELVISPATVARHVANMMIKLGFRSRAQIAVWVTEAHRGAGQRPGTLLPACLGLLHGQLGGGIGLEPLVGYELAADHRPAVGARLEPRQRAVDRRQPFPELCGDRGVFGLLSQRKPGVPEIDGAVGRLPVNPVFVLSLAQQRRHLGPLRPQQCPRPALVHV
jgi:predicted ATPase/DNA-binding NarL/FixJ family response regulator